jgi:hypothetical protein
LDVEADVLVQGEGFLAIVVTAVVGLEEFHVLVRSFATLKSGKTSTATRRACPHSDANPGL